MNICAQKSRTTSLDMLMAPIIKTNILPFKGRIPHYQAFYKLYNRATIPNVTEPSAISRERKVQVLLPKSLIYVLTKMLNLVFTKHLLFIIDNFKIKGTL